MSDYSGLLQRPALAEHWHKGFGAGLAAWLPVFLFVAWLLPEHLFAAVVLASCSSIGILAAAATHYEGFELQLNLRRYRKYIWVAGLRFGTWQPLPEIYKVTLRPTNRRHFLPMSDTSDGFGFIANESKWQVLLNRTDSPIGVIAAVVEYSKARSSAEKLSALLQIPLDEQQ